MEKELTIIERPRICCIDLSVQDFEFLKGKNYYLFQGSLGSTMKVPNTSRHSSHYILLDYKFPENFHEYDILILDLTTDVTREYKKEDHVISNIKNNSFYQIRCSYPTTLFDPKPLTASYLANLAREIHGRKLLQVVFACKNYEVDYEVVKIADYIEDLPNERHSIYSFSDTINLSTERNGTEVSVCEYREDISNLLTKYCKDLSYEQTFSHPTIYIQEKGNYFPDPNFIPLLKNINNEIVSFAKFDEHSISIVFPNIKVKGLFLGELLTSILPSIVPTLFPFSTQFKWKDSNEYFLPNHSVLLNEKTEIEIDFRKKIDNVNLKILENYSKFHFLHELITETGDQLVHAVHKFMCWLEFPKVIIKDEEATSVLEEDLQIEYDKGLLIIETKGIGGTSTDNDCSQISKIKLRRSKERNAFDVSALYIVNHQRYLPPLTRKNPPFTENQIKDAVNDERGLLTTWQLFNLYFDIENQLISKEHARNGILKYGLIEFKPKIKAKLPSTKQLIKDGQVVIMDIVDFKLRVGQILIAEKNERYFKTEIKSIRLNDISVDEVENGEIGIKLDRKISNGTILWTQ